MMLRPEVRTSAIAACSAASVTSTTPPHFAPCLSKPKPRSPIMAASSFSRRWFSTSPSSNSTSRIASGSPCTKAFSVGRNIAISLASSSMVRSTSSTAIGLSLTRCCAAFIAS